jgi:hypothetical protein
MAAMIHHRASLCTNPQPQIAAYDPSVLAGIAFISNPQEERPIKNTQIRQAIAESLFEGVRSFIGVAKWPESSGEQVS